MRERTINQALERADGMFPGLSTMRVGAIGALVLVHVLLVSTSYPLLTRRIICAVGPVATIVLFACLGLAIADAVARKPARQVVTDWLRRCGPVYALAIVAAAAIVGPLASTTSPRDYVGDPALWRYLTNLLFVPQFTLPGVFGFNDLQGVVNGIVWMAPVHLALLVIAIGVARLPARLRVVAPIGIAVGVAAGMIAIGFGDGPTSPFTIEYLFERGDALAAFLAGVGAIAVFAGRRRIAIGRWARRGAMLGLALLVLVGSVRLIDTALFRSLLVVPTLCLVVHYATRALRLEQAAERVKPLAAGLLWFSFPVQQLAVAIGPSGQNAVVNLALSLPIVAALAFGTRYLARFKLGPDPSRSAAPAIIAASASVTSAPVTNAPITRPAPPRRRRPIAARFAGAGNFLIVAALFLAAVFGAMAMLYLALQRDTGGV